jgi:hypothetical protein
LTPLLGESGRRFSITNISGNSKPISNGSKCSVTELCRTDLCKNPRKSASLPCPFNFLQKKVPVRCNSMLQILLAVGVLQIKKSMQNIHYSAGFFLDLSTCKSLSWFAADREQEKPERPVLFALD